MKKKYWLAGVLAMFLWQAKAQTPQDSLPTKVNKSNLDLVYNHYLQDGNNSAVTGGIGTEKLVVYAPSISYKRTKGTNEIAFQGGVDLISSASTDNIDFVVSSASSFDARFYLNGNYSKTLPAQNLILSGGLSTSGESDYLSWGAKIGIAKDFPEKLRSYEITFQTFQDDLRWGRRLTKWDSLQLIYPSELRKQKWYDGYRRSSYNLKLGLTQVLNKRHVLGIFPELAYQHGVLATPFHRVYFEDSVVSVEQLPDTRWKGTLALQLNSFLGGRVILKNTLQGYTDSFGIRGWTAENETVIKLNPEVSLMPNVRFYTQTGSRYFAPYRVHNQRSTFHTSDYDLAPLQTYQVGFGIKYAPFKALAKSWVFNTGLFRYSFMYRSNGLTAHTFSLTFQTEWAHKKKVKKK